MEIYLDYPTCVHKSTLLVEIPQRAQADHTGQTLTRLPVGDEIWLNRDDFFPLLPKVTSTSSNSINPPSGTQFRDAWNVRQKHGPAIGIRANTDLWGLKRSHM